MRTLETKRLILHAWRLEDAEAMFSYARGEKVGPRAGWKPHENVAESESIIRMFIEEDETWALALREEGRPIGSVGLHKTREENVRELGYVLSEKYWGRGIMPEAAEAVLRFAFEELGLSKVTVGHFPFNMQSKRVIEKLGFSYTGYFEKAFERFDGVKMDECRYEMTKEAFRLKG